MKDLAIPSEQDDNRRSPRLGNGRFVPGRSGNPGGRPKTIEEMQLKAREHTGEAFDALVQILRAGEPIERIQAAKIILERAWGKPLQPLITESPEEKPFVPILNITIEK